MAHVELDEHGQIVITSEYRERELIKLVPGTKWHNAERVWKLPLSWASCVALRGVFGADLSVGATLAAWARDERELRVEPALLMRSAENATGDERLYPFQRVGSGFMQLAEGCALCADEMGTGKTIQALDLASALDAWPALVVCPNSMKYTWAGELQTWVPNVKVIVVHGGAAARRKQLAQVLELAEAGERVAAIINWEGLRGHTRLAGYGSTRLTEEEKEERELNAVAWHLVIADEAHRAKDPKAKQTRALWGVAKDAPRRIALTGTPVANSPEDLWSIMHFVAPDEWPSKTRFIERYCLKSWNNFGGMDVIGLKSETRDELFRFLDPRFIRRPKEAVLPQLPVKQYTTRYVELGQKQARAYKQVRDEYMVLLESGALLATNPLQRLTRLLQFASAFGEIDDDGNLKLTEPSSKVDALMDVAEEMGGQPFVVAAESRQLIELAAARLRKGNFTCAEVTGAVDPVTRQASVEAFQRGDLQAILLTMGAGGEGITLTAADTMIFLQRSFSLIKNSQTEDRIHRIGQERPVTIIDLVALDTIETRVHEVRRDKLAKLEEVARDAATIKEWLS